MPPNTYFIDKSVFWLILLFVSNFHQQVASTYSAFFGQVQDIAFLPGGDEFISAAEVVQRNSTDKGIMVWDFRSTAILSNQIYQVCQWQTRPTCNRLTCSQ